MSGGQIDADGKGLPLIFIYGPPGSGKSTLGKRLALELDLPFFDLDDLIAARAGRAIPAIFAEAGESAFRGLERNELLRLMTGPQSVIALGGGALLDGDLRARVEASGRVLFLEASHETLLSRLQAGWSSRPLLDGGLDERLRALLSARRDHYLSFPHRIGTDDLPLDQVAWQAMICLGFFRVRGMGPAYDVRVEGGGLRAVGEHLRQRQLSGPLAVVADENVGPLYKSRLYEPLSSAGYAVHWVQIPPGEQYKTIATVATLWDHFLAAGIERGSTILALGGGVVGDLVGFAAATFLRGVSWVVLPTTLVSMVDSSLGGKTGADLPAGKNLVGAFHPPRLVLADPETLSTLPIEELRSGMAEVIKHGVIGDPDLFTFCEEFDLAVSKAHMQTVVRRAMAVKVDVIQKDPYEKGQRAALNLGHTVGHAVEVLSDYRLRHGEAVAIGLVVEARISERLGLASPGLSEQIAAVLRKHRLPVHIPAGMPAAGILSKMRVDKKRTGGSLRFALPVRIGEVHIGVRVDDQDILQELR